MFIGEIYHLQIGIVNSEEAIIKLGRTAPFSIYDCKCKVRQKTVVHIVSKYKYLTCLVQYVPW